MANNNKALAYSIPVGDPKADSFQSVPTWLLTFLSFKNPSPIDTNPKERESATAMDNPFLVTSDCISLVVQQSKANHNPSFEATLVGGRINYLAKISPGDYVTINISHNPETISKLYAVALRSEPVNKINSGFKGVFKVTSIREVVQVEGDSGKKRINYLISGSAFTELNNIVYFNPYVTPTQVKDLFYMSTAFNAYFNGDPGQGKNALGLQTYMQLLLSIIFGTPLGDVKDGAKITPNRAFEINGKLASIMGSPNAKSFRQFYRYYFGIQKFRGSELSEKNTVLGTVPENSNPSNQTYFCNPRVTGQSIVNPEYWNKVPGWSILSQYSNAPINELFTHFKVVPENGGMIMPCMTFRQTPFSSQKLVKNYPKQAITAFLSLPRWVLSSSIIKNYSIGRDDSLRTNFVQIFGLPQNIQKPERIITEQTSRMSNVALDRADIVRSGLRPNTWTSHFDFEKAGGGWVSWWSILIGDATIGSHMKLNGSVETVGIEQDITVGDNIQMGGIVYHIEALSHRCSVNANGSRNFSTTMAFSQGVDDSKEDEFKVYGETVNKMYSEAYGKDYGYKWNLLPNVVNEQEEE